MLESCTQNRYLIYLNAIHLKFKEELKLLLGHLISVSNILTFLKIGCVAIYEYEFAGSV